MLPVGRLLVWASLLTSAILALELKITARSKLTGVFYKDTNGTVVSRTGLAFSNIFDMLDDVTIPNTAEVFGFCASNTASSTALLAAEAVDGGELMLVTGTVYNYHCIGVDMTGDNGWLNNYYYPVGWILPVVWSSASDVQDVHLSVDMCWVHLNESSDICCRMVLIEPDHPCVDPSLCWPGTCLRVGPDYDCDCEGTGFTGNKSCDVPIPRSGCGVIQSVRCTECAWSASQVECDQQGTNICYLHDPVCLHEERYYANGTLQGFRRTCAERDMQPTGRAHNITSVDTVTSTSKSAWLEFGTCHDGPCEAGQDLYCLTCKAFGDVPCLMHGIYVKCKADEICYHKFWELGVKTIIQRGCRSMDDCPTSALGKNAQHCIVIDEFNHKSCVNCDYAMPPPVSRQPERSRYTCDMPVEGYCSCKGDPHCSTYDNFVIKQVPSTCWHLFTRTECYGGLPLNSTGGAALRVQSTFRVEIKIRDIPPHKWAVQEVKVYYKSTTIHMGQANGVVMVGDKVEKLPEGIMTLIEASSGESLIFDFNDLNDTLEIIIPNGIKVRWDFHHAILVIVPDAFRGQMCGICGNFDGDVDVGDFTFGYPDAGDECPTQSTSLHMKIPGTQGAGRTDEHSFALSWFTATGGPDSACHDYCGL